MSLGSESREAPRRAAFASWLFGLAFRSVFANVECGQIVVASPSDDRFEARASAPGPDAAIEILNWRAVLRVLTRGPLGFAEGFVSGDWSSPDLAALLEFVARNFTGRNRRFPGLLLARVVGRLRHLVRANTRTGSRRNVAFHYDLGNEFYGSWLDPEMIYSSALFERSDQPLEAAQEAKIRRILDLLDLSGDEEVLEIGCGWGALAMRIARSGARVKAVTLSRRQFDFARSAVVAQGLEESVLVKLEDYRDLQGGFDKIVSIEMLEAVGEAYWPTFFSTLRDRLKSGGEAVVQVITIDEMQFDAYRASADFIQAYIFPGGMLPTKTILAEQAKAAGLAFETVETFGASYARTLAEWRRQFLSSWPKLHEAGVSLQFRRLWEYYFCYCEAGFKAGAIDVGLYVFARLDAKRS